MSMLPCRYFFSKGMLRREEGRISFYREMFDEPKLEKSWKDGEWRALRLHRSFFELELLLVLQSGSTERLEVSLSEEEVIAWIESVGLTLTTEDEAPADSWNPLPDAAVASMPSVLSPVQTAPPEPPAPASIQESVEVEPPAPPEPPVLEPVEDAVSVSLLPEPEVPAQEAFFVPDPPEPVSFDVVSEPPPVRHARSFTPAPQTTLVQRMFPTPMHWAIVMVLFFIFPILGVMYGGYRYNLAQKRSL